VGFATPDPALDSPPPTLREKEGFDLDSGIAWIVWFGRRSEIFVGVFFFFLRFARGGMNTGQGLKAVIPDVTLRIAG
jgi:hypothetical protein